MSGRLPDLEPTVEQLLERHLRQTKEWHPHALGPWSRGKDFGPDYEWSPEEANLTQEARSALFVNVLTEENLPYYFRDSERLFGRDGAWGEWVRRWTAEEGRHGRVIYDYLSVTRALDPVALGAGPHGNGAVRAGARTPRHPGGPCLRDTAGIGNPELRTSTQGATSTTPLARPSCAGSPSMRICTSSSIGM